MKTINENVSIYWVEDDVWKVFERFEGQTHEYYMTADEIEATWGDVWQC